MVNGDGLGNIISADGFRSVEGYNNIAVILLILFVLWDCLHLLFVDINAINDNYLSFCWAICCLYYQTLDDDIKYYATNILQIRKSKIDECELAAKNDHMFSLEENMME